MILYNRPTVVRFRSVMVSWFCVKHTSKRWFLKIVHVTMKHGPFETLHPSCIHLLHWSLQHSVKQMWTSFAFSTNESS